MLIAKGQFIGRGTHKMSGRFEIEEDTNGKLQFATSDDFFFDGSTAPGFAISASGDLTKAEALATDFLRLPTTGRSDRKQQEVRGKLSGEIPESIDIKAAKAIFLWCYEVPVVLGVGEIK